MKETLKLKERGYYLFESLAAGRNCYFENRGEILFFKMLFRRYLNAYVEIHKMYLSAEGYHILVRIRGKVQLEKKYLEDCLRKKKEVRHDFLEEPWKIISERIRIMHSVYAKGVNKFRSREGVLVKQRYKRYYFTDLHEFESYVGKMERQKKEIKSQRNKRYRAKKGWVKKVNWGLIRGVGFVESLMSRGFQDYVVSDLINSTLKSHSPPP